MARRAPPPTDAAPISSDVVEIVKKKLAAPRDAPPAAMTNFKPRSLPQRYDDDDRPDEKRTMRYYDADELDQSFASDSSPIRANERSRPRQIMDDDDYEFEENSDRNYRRQSDETSGREYDREERYRQERESTTTRAAGAKQSAPAPAQSEVKVLRPGVMDMTQAKGVRLLTYNFLPVLNGTYRDLREFAFAPIQPGIIVRCYIERNRSGMNMMYPLFTMCADLEDGTGREMFVCKKVMQSMTPHYVFSLKVEDLYRPREQRSRLFLGKLRQTNPNEYVLYDDGMMKLDSKDGGDGDDDAKAYEATFRQGSSSRPSSAAPSAADGSADNPGSSSSLYRKELAVIYFNTTTRPVPLGVRGCEVGIPAVRFGFAQCSEEAVEAASKSTAGSQSTSIMAPFHKARKAGLQNAAHFSKCYIMHEKASRYDALSSCLVDFKSRANVASVKNFQLVRSGFQVMPSTDPMFGKDQIERDAAEEYLLQMGKTTEDCFNVDFKYPLSPLQAFAICIARFDAKLSW